MLHDKHHAFILKKRFQMDIVSYILLVILNWLNIFIAPFKDMSMLLILVPAYLSLLISELYEENKKAAYFSMTIAGFVSIIASFGWLWVVLGSLKAPIAIDSFAAIKLVWAVILIIYGMILVVNGIKKNSEANSIYSIRVAMYAVIVLTPLAYGAIELNLVNLALVVLFYPAFHYLIEWISMLTPNMRSYEDTTYEERARILGEIKTHVGKHGQETHHHRHDYSDLKN